MSRMSTIIGRRRPVNELNFKLTQIGIVMLGATNTARSIAFYRDKLGLVRNWPHQGTYEQFSGLDLLPSVETVVKSYQRWSI